MNKKKLVSKIRKTVQGGHVDELFKSSDFRFLLNYPNFIASHAVGNCYNPEYFIRISRGIYKLKEY